MILKEFLSVISKETLEDDSPILTASLQLQLAVSTLASNPVNYEMQMLSGRQEKKEEDGFSRTDPAVFTWRKKAEQNCAGEMENQESLCLQVCRPRRPLLFLPSAPYNHYVASIAKAVTTAQKLQDRIRFPWSWKPERWGERSTAVMEHQCPHWG